jgi:hypothetical protein
MRREGLRRISPSCRSYYVSAMTVLSNMATSLFSAERDLAASDVRGRTNTRMNLIAVTAKRADRGQYRQGAGVPGPHIKSRLATLFLLLAWRISTLRSCVGDSCVGDSCVGDFGDSCVGDSCIDAAVNDFGSWERHRCCRECGPWRRRGYCGPIILVLWQLSDVRRNPPSIVP